MSMAGVLGIALALGGSGLADEIGLRTTAAHAGLIELRRDLHAHPELPNREYRTGKVIATRLRELGLDVSHPVAKTGVVGSLAAGDRGPTVVVRADMDALPIAEANDVPYRSTRGGIMHACGHDVHMAIAIGVAEVLRQVNADLGGRVVLLFQPAEEGAPRGESGGAARVLAEDVIAWDDVALVLGLHVDPTLEAGSIGWTDGVVFASRDSFEIGVEGRQVHGAYPRLGLDPIPVAAELVLALMGLVPAESAETVALSIGTIHGGDWASLLAPDVRLEGTLRALSEDERAATREGIASAVSSVCGRRGTTGTLRFRDEGVPVLVNDAAAAREVRRHLADILGEGSIRYASPQMGADDFALLAQRAPGVYLRLGVRNELRGITAPVHTDRFDVDEAAIAVGVRALSAIVLEALRSHSGE